MGQMGTGGYDDLDDFEEEGEREKQEEVIGASLLLGDRATSEQAELIANSLFKVLLKVPEFADMQNLILTLSLQSCIDRKGDQSKL